MNARTVTDDLTALLHRHYIKPGDRLPGGVFLTEVQLPGAGPSRYLDALYVGFTRSRGEHIEGHEIKASRQDWLRELENREKADRWWHRVHRWWIVAPSTDVVRPEELPAGWGLLLPARNTTTRMHQQVRAEVKAAEVDARLLLEIAKKLDTARVQQVADAQENTRRETFQECEEELDALRREKSGDGMNPTDRQRLEQLRRLEQSSGLQLDSYADLVGDVGDGRVSPEEAGAALAESAGTLAAHRQVMHTHSTMRRLRDGLGSAQREMDKLLGMLPQDPVCRCLRRHHGEHHDTCPLIADHAIGR